MLQLRLHPWPPTYPLYHCLPPTRPPLPVPCVLSNAGEVSSCLETEEAELTVSIAFPYLKRQDLPGLLGSPVQHTCHQSTHQDPLPINTLVLLPLSARSSQRTTWQVSCICAEKHIAVRMCLLTCYFVTLISILTLVSICPQNPVFDCWTTLEPAFSFPP